MAAQGGLVKRVIRIPLEVATGQMMQQFYQQVHPLIFSDGIGPMAWFNNYYLPDSSLEFTVLEWIMTSANDAQFINGLPAMLAQVGLTSVQTYSVNVSVGF